MGIVAGLVSTGSAVALSEPASLDRKVSSLASAAAGDAAAAQLGWRRSDAVGVRSEGGVVAVAARDGWIAVAGADRVAVGRWPLARSAASFSLEGVEDLAFDEAGRLFAATRRGLWLHGARDARELRDVSPGAGEEARRVRRIATSSGFVAVATDGGAFVGSPAGAELRWRRVDAGFPSGPVADVELAGQSLWAIVGSALWQVEITPDGRFTRPREVALPERSHGQVPVDVVAGLPAGGVALVDADSILLAQHGDHARPQDWSIVRPVLPPGAAMRRLGHWQGGYWLATDRGLLVSRSAIGPWRRAGSPAGRATAHSAAPLGESLFVASAAGLLVGEPAVGRAATRNPARHGFAPSIRAVQRAVLRRQGLEPRDLDRAFRGVRRRGWLPSVDLRLDADRDRARGRTHDEAFVSGGYRTLHDRDRDRSLDLGASLVLSWDLRDLAFEPEQIDLSREARLVIGLRDDVLDEVNQLYFERLAIENELAASDRMQEQGEAARPPGVLRLRLREVTAGLDAWTGGWFSEQLERSLPAPE